MVQDKILLLQQQVQSWSCRDVSYQPFYVSSHRFTKDYKIQHITSNPQATLYLLCNSIMTFLPSTFLFCLWVVHKAIDTTFEVIILRLSGNCYSLDLSCPLFGLVLFDYCYGFCYDPFCFIDCFDNNGWKMTFFRDLLKCKCIILTKIFKGDVWTINLFLILFYKLSI